MLRRAPMGMRGAGISECPPPPIRRVKMHSSQAEQCSALPLCNGYCSGFVFRISFSIHRLSTRPPAPPPRVWHMVRAVGPALHSHSRIASPISTRRALEGGEGYTPPLRHDSACRPNRLCPPPPRYGPPTVFVTARPRPQAAFCNRRSPLRQPPSEPSLSFLHLGAHRCPNLSGSTRELTSTTQRRPLRTCHWTLILLPSLPPWTPDA